MEDKPIKSKRVSGGTRVYYFDVRKDKRDKKYLAISEIPTDDSPGKKKRQRIFIHSENIDDFVKALTELAEEIKNGTEG